MSAPAPASASATHMFAVPLPHALGAKIHVHLTIASHHLLLFLTSRTPESPGGPAPLGSFVYALSPVRPPPLRPRARAR